MALSEPIGAAPLVLPAVLDLANATFLQQLLVDHCEQGGAVVLDGSAVERVSTACLQVLVAAAKAAQSHGRAFTLAAASHTLASAINDLALDRHLPVGSPL
jgi:anti-anti-sigma regulatory factor